MKTNARLLTVAAGAAIAVLAATPASASGSWTEAAVPDPGHRVDIDDIEALSASDAYAVGDGAGKAGAWHWDGSSWTTVPTDLPLIDLDSSPSGLWGVANVLDQSTGINAAAAAKWDGTAWRAIGVNVPQGVETRFSTVGTGASGAWATGVVARPNGQGVNYSHAFVTRLDGSSVTELPELAGSQSSDPGGIAVAPNGDVHIVGTSVVPVAGGSSRPIPTAWRLSNGSWQVAPIQLAGGRDGSGRGVTIYRGTPYYTVEVREGALTKPVLMVRDGELFRTAGTLPANATGVQGITADDRGGIAVLLGTGTTPGLLYRVMDGGSTVTDLPAATSGIERAYFSANWSQDGTRLWIGGTTWPYGGSAGRALTAYLKA